MHNIVAKILKLVHNYGPGGREMKLYTTHRIENAASANMSGIASSSSLFRSDALDIMTLFHASAVITTNIIESFM